MLRYGPFGMGGLLGLPIANPGLEVPGTLIELFVLAITGSLIRCPALDLSSLTHSVGVGLDLTGATYRPVLGNAINTTSWVCVLDS